MRYAWMLGVVMVAGPAAGQERASGNRTTGSQPVFGEADLRAQLTALQEENRRLKAENKTLHDRIGKLDGSPERKSKRGGRQRYELARRLEAAKASEKKEQELLREIADTEAEFEGISKARIDKKLGTEYRKFGRNGYVFQSLRKKSKMRALAAGAMRKAKERHEEWTKGGKRLVVATPILNTKTMEVGDLGELRDSTLEVQQVVDSKNVMLYSRWGDTRFWLRGYSTKDLVDGKGVDIPGILEVVGTKSYTTTLGSKATILLLEPLNMDDLANAKP